MVYADSSAPAEGNPPGGGQTGGDPVDLATGLFELQATDLALPGLIPIVLSRMYRPRDTASRAFGIGANHPYNIFLAGDYITYSYTDLILADGSRIHYVRTNPGNYFIGAEYESTATPTAFYKSRIKWNGTGWDLTLKDGTLYVFGDVAPLQYIRDRYGNKLLITHSNNQTGNITKITSTNGRWIEFTYDSSNRITQAKDNIGRTVGYTYDASGRLWKVTNPLSEVTEYTYDSSHRMLTIKDARGLVYSTNQYDANGRVTLQTQTDGTTFQFAYTLDANGKVTQTEVTDPRGNVRRVTFNSKGYALSETFAIGKPEVQTFTYNRQSGTNLLLSMTDPLSRRTDLTYDAMGNVSSVTALAGTADTVTATFTYEPVFNQVATVTDPLNHTTQFGYDGKGNLTSFYDPLSNQMTFGDNLSGQATTATNVLGKTTQFDYYAGDLVNVTGPMGQTVNRFVDSAGRVLSVTDPLGRTAKFEYDLLNRPSRITNPSQGSTTSAYDPNGNLLSVTDAHNNAISNVYDNMDRVQSRTDPLLRASTYLYDNNGNLRQITDRKSQVTSYTYDSLNRLTLVTYADNSTSSYTYDGGNRVTQVVDSNSGIITYTYDNFDRVLSEATPQGTVSYTYDAKGRRTTMAVPNQATVSYSYDSGDRLIQISQGTSTVSFSYDAASRLTTQTLPNGVVTEYAYDDASRLINLTYRKSGNTLGNLAYTYDSAGRRTKKGGTLAITGLPEIVTSTSYNSVNQQTGFAGQTLTYDNNGNLTNDGTNTYTWNARNQLVSMARIGLSAAFQYDALGRRSSKTINTATTSFLFDGLNIVQEQSGASQIANMLTGGIDQLFSRSDSSGTVNTLADALGSSVALTDSNGAIQTQYSYEPFGQATTSGNASGNPSKFTGRDDDGTGLYYYRARYYAPRSQRFISEDPIGEDGGSNFYEYVLGDPVNLNDALGLKPQEPGSGGGGYDFGGYFAGSRGGFPPHGHRPSWDKGGQRWYEGGGAGEPRGGPRAVDSGGKPIDTTYDPYENTKPGTGARNIQEEGRGLGRPLNDKRYPKDGNWRLKAKWVGSKAVDGGRRLVEAFGEWLKGGGPGNDVIIILTPPEIIQHLIRGRIPTDIKSTNTPNGTQDQRDVRSTERAGNYER